MTMGTSLSPFLPVAHAPAVRMVAVSQQFRFCRTVVSLSMSSDYMACLGCTASRRGSAAGESEDSACDPEGAEQ